jgi:rhodanese-related sulfurtransferase
MGTMIDVREYPEFASGHINGSRLVPLGGLTEASKSWNKAEALTLVCKSGKRAEQGRQQLLSQGFTSVSILPGGIDGWKGAGKPLMAGTNAPWSMERQVRTTAGILILLTMGLAYLISAKFLIATALVGAGLVFAGVSNTCMMAAVLAKLPWNRVPATLA